MLLVFERDFIITLLHCCKVFDVNNYIFMSSLFAKLLAPFW